MADSRYAQLTLREVEILRQPRGLKPVFDLHLGAHERIVGMHHYWVADERDRATVDHHATLWIEVQL